MGLGPLQAIYQARFNRYLAEPRDRRHQPGQGVVLRRRRRNRRARDARRAVAGRARRARQSDLRRELQPAAPRRSGARQRQDHPGTRSGVPRRRLERHQGHLGLQVGRAARPRHRRRAAQPDEHHRRRRVPEVRGVGRRVHPRPLLRPRPAAAQDRRAPHRRRDPRAAPRRPRLPQALRRVQGRGRARGRADGDPRQDDQGLDARPRDRGAQRHAPDQEDDQGAAARHPRHAVPAGRDPRDGARREAAAVLPARRRLGDSRVPDDAPPGARRVAAAPPPARRAARSCRRRDRSRSS